MYEDRLPCPVLDFGELGGGGEYRKTAFVDIMKKIPDICIYGILFVGDSEHPLSKMISDRFNELHQLSGDKLLLVVFDPPESYTDSFKQYWKDKLGNDFDSVWTECHKNIGKGVAYRYGDFFTPKIEEEKFPCFALFTDLEDIENRKVILRSIPYLDSETLYEFFEQILIASIKRCCEKPEEQRLNCLQSSLDFTTMKVAPRSIQLKRYIERNPVRVVYFASSFLLLLASGNILPLGLGRAAVAFLKAIKDVANK